MIIEQTIGTETTLIDPADAGTITKQSETDSFQFVADDFTFSREDGSDVMDLIADGEEISLRVLDDDGAEYFNGFLDAEGTQYTEATGRYDFRAVQYTKDFAESLKDKPAEFWYYSKPDSGTWDFVEPDLFPPDYLQQILQHNLGMPVLIPDIFVKTGSSPDSKKSDAFKDDNYTAYDLLLDACKYLNSVFWVATDTNGVHFDIGTQYVLFQHRDINRGRDVMLNDELIDGFVRRLRGREFRGVMFIAENGKLGIETVDSYESYSDADQKYNKIYKKDLIDLTTTNRDLDLKWNTYNSSGKVNPQGDGPLNYVFPRRTDAKQGVWQGLLAPKQEIEIRYMEIIPLDIFDRVFFKSYMGAKVYRVEWDIIDETTTIIARI